MIFAVLFKKQFLCIEREYAGNERLESLFSILGIRDKFFKSVDEIDWNNILEEDIDYPAVHSKLVIEKKKSLKFLLQFVL